MGNFDRICKQIDEKHDHVMEMLANIQEQLRVLEMNRRKGSRVDFGVANAQSQIQFSSLDQSPKPAPKGENEGISNIEVVTGSATISKSSNDTKLENEEYVELLNYVPSIVTVAMEAYYSTTKATEIQEQRVFDEMPESEKSKISDILPPLVLGSEIDEVCDFSVSNPQFQMPLECLLLISSPSSFGFSLDDTKLEDEGLVDVPIHTSVAELQLQESKSEFERLENFLDLSLPKFIPSWRIMVSSLLHLPSLYKCYGVEALTKEELIWLDTGQYLMVSGLSREGVTSNFTGSWNLMALQSGLKSELTWALNALTFISFKEEDEVPKDAPSLAMNLGLLDALLKVIGDWLNIALLIVLAKTPRVRLLGANAVVTGFGSEYESINIGDSVSYHIVGSGGYSNDNPCSQKNIAKSCSSVWWFEGDGLLNLDEEGRAVKQQCAAAVSNIIRSFFFMVENKIAMGHNRHCLETMFHCLQDYVTKDEEQLVTNFEFGLFEQEVVENDCQIFEANFQVKAATKYALESDLTKENQRISSILELEDDFLVATVFEAYGCKDKLFDRPPLKPPFQCRHLIESWGQDSFKRGVLS